MGIIRAAAGAIGGALADSWLDAIAAEGMGEGVVMARGAKARQNDRRSANRKGNDDVISNGSVIMVAENQCMLLTDGGKIIDYSAAPGYYKVDESCAPSLFNGELMESVKDSFRRFQFGGGAPYSQRVYYINTQEIKNIPFGTPAPLNYFDNFYNAELYLRANGYFSIRIIDPVKFYCEAVPRDADNVNIQDIYQLYLAEFLTALQTTIGKMSVEGVRVSHIGSKSQEVADTLSAVLDASWTQRRGMVIESVGINAITYDEASRKLIDIRSQGAMLSDAGIREGYVQGAVARGIENAGSNQGGAMAGMMGVGLGMQAGGGFVAAASAANQAQMAQQQQPASAPSGGWICACGQSVSGNFCSECGAKKPAAAHCTECGAKLPEGAKFCPGCGSKA